MLEGITTSAELGIPDYELALREHDDYIAAMKACGVNVTVLPANEDFPDSCFVEDPAVVTRACAVITNPATVSRRGEAELILPTIREFYPDEHIHYIKSPGTLEGGDVMMVGDHFYVGLSKRTNEEGIRQFSEILALYGMTCSAVPLTTVLHLKTGMTYMENNLMLVSGEFMDKPGFEKYDKLRIPDNEAYAVNCIYVNGQIIMPANFPATEILLRDAGLELIIVDTSEYRKIDGGLSCLSLRF